MAAADSLVCSAGDSGAESPAGFSPVRARPLAAARALGAGSGVGCSAAASFEVSADAGGALGGGELG